jgi:hypothetical protein
VTAEDLRARLAELRGGVKVLQPGTVYSLASSDSPLPLTISNDLPVAVDVRVVLSGTQGLRVKPVATKTVPAQSTLPLLLPAEVVRSGSFVVDAGVTTPGGTALGPPSRLQLRSTAYGTVTLVLTICAFVALVGLSLFRIVRRFRATRRPTTPDLTDHQDGPPDGDDRHGHAKLSTPEAGGENRAPV